MRIFVHPSFSHIEDVCNHAPAECDHEAKGWIPLLTDEQQARFDEIELEVELAPQRDRMGGTLSPRKNVRT